MLFAMAKRGASTRRNRRADKAASATATALYALVIEAVRRNPRTMSMTSLSTLSTLERTGPRRITDLAVVEGVTQPSMTALVRVLERDGLVARRGDPGDGRVALVTVTTAGSELVRSRRRAGAESFAQLIDKLSHEDSSTLAAAIPALERLRALGEGSSGSSAPLGEISR
jgi:DNA-binding MarR family transcriptional regulator